MEKSNYKEKCYKFITEFSSIKMTDICKSLGIHRTNILSGNASLDKMIQVKDEISKRIIKIYEEYYSE